MTEAVDLERGYRRWLRLYPKTFRRQHEPEMLDVLMASARPGQRQPPLIECLDLMGSALRIRLRPRVPRSDRSVYNALKLMYLGATVELAVAITIVATVDDVKAHVVERHPGLTEVEWQAIVSGQLAPLAVAACVAVVLWLWMAWALGRRRRSTRIVFAIFVGANTFGLFNGLAHGSAVYARPDLAVGAVLWLIELAAVAAIFRMKSAAPLRSAYR